MASVHLDAATPEEACGVVVDLFRHLLSTLGALLATTAGQLATQDAASSRSLPAIGKSLQRLWFETPCGVGRDTKEEAVWLCRLMAVLEGSRAGILSFYGAGLLVCDCLGAFAAAAVGEPGKPDGAGLDEAWLAGVWQAQEVLCGRHYERLQSWPADRHCGGGSPPLVSTDRLPRTMRRAMDLEGVRMNNAHYAGLGMAMLLPGGMTVGMGGVGLVLLLRGAKDLGAATAVRWDGIQAKCLERAHRKLRQKSCPIRVAYKPGPPGAFLYDVVKVALYAVNDVFCALPGGLSSVSSHDGSSAARLRLHERCVLQPPGGADTFRLRVYRPAPLLDLLLHDGVEVRRGDNVAIMPTASGGVKVVAAQEQPAAVGRGQGERAAERPQPAAYASAGRRVEGPRPEALAGDMAQTEGVAEGMQRSEAADFPPLPPPLEPPGPAQTARVAEGPRPVAAAAAEAPTERFVEETLPAAVSGAETEGRHRHPATATAVEAPTTDCLAEGAQPAAAQAHPAAATGAEVRSDCAAEASHPAAIAAVEVPTERFVEAAHPAAVSGADARTDCMAEGLHPAAAACFEAQTESVAEIVDPVAAVAVDALSEHVAEEAHPVVEAGAKVQTGCLAEGSPPAAAAVVDVQTESVAASFAESVHLAAVAAVDAQTKTVAEETHSAAASGAVTEESHPVAAARTECLSEGL